MKSLPLLSCALALGLVAGGVSGAAGGVGAGATASATFGNTAVGAARTSTAADRKRVSKFALAEGGVISELVAYLDGNGGATSGSQAVRGVIYADRAGIPGALRCVSGEVRVAKGQAAAWVHMAVAGSCTLGADSYWLGAHFGRTAKVARYFYDVVAGAMQVKSDAYGNGPSDPFGSGSSAAKRLSIYAVYTPTAARANTAPAAEGGSATTSAGAPISITLRGRDAESCELEFAVVDRPTGGSLGALVPEACSPGSPNTDSAGVTYTPAPGFSGSDSFTFRVSDGLAESAQSTVTIAVDPARAPQPVSAPTVEGTPEVGRTLVADPGSWSGDEPIAYAYQWERCTATGSHCSDVAGATESSYTLVPADASATIRVRVTASNAGGSTAATSTRTAPVAATDWPTGDPVVAAAGDIACDPAGGSFNGGLGTASACRQKYTSDLLVGGDLAAVLALGDNQYECGGYSAFLQSYDASWGRVKSVTHPAPGNHEYSSSGGTGCSAGASGYFTYFGEAAGDPTKGYYSFDVGAWHLIALNSNCSPVGGCGAGSPQEQWLRADLAAHPAQCTIAYWHHPRFSSGQHGSNATYDAFWRALYERGADLVLVGHDHDYERFPPVDPGGGYDPERGIREFVVGTGGKSVRSFGTVQPTSEVRHSGYGVLKLTLHATGYEWRFVSDAGSSFSDAGASACR